MRLCDVFVPGDPKGQPRARAFAFKGKARLYTPGTAEHWKGQIAAYFPPGQVKKQAGPVAMELVFYFRRPKSHFRKNGTVTPKHRGLGYAIKPDIDNLVKAVFDALTTMGVWEDDDQVVSLLAQKFYVWDRQQQSGCRIKVDTVGY